MTASMQLFVDMGSGPAGPFTVEQVEQLIRTGMVKAQTQISLGPTMQAVPACMIVEFEPLLRECATNASRNPSSDPPVPKPRQDPTQQSASPRKKALGTALAAVLGVGVCASFLANSARPTDPGKPNATADTSANVSTIETSGRVQESKPPAPDCDAHSLWFDVLPHFEREPDAVQAEFVGLVKAWSPECRMKAMASECDPRCDTFLSDMIIQAASTKEESRALRTLRHRGNSAAIDRATELLQRTKKLVAYAQSIIGTPRASAYYTPRATADEMSEDLARAEAGGNPCFNRMKIDFAKVEALKKEVADSAKALPLGVPGSLDVVLSYTQNCLDCSDNRELCADMRSQLKTVQENLAEWSSDNALDAKALGRR